MDLAGMSWHLFVACSSAHDLSAGSFKRPLFAPDGTTCVGVQTVDGTEYHADKVVLAAGAWSPALVDLEDQCVSKVNKTSIAPLGLILT